MSANWHITHSETHWSTVGTMADYVEKVLEPWIVRKRAALGLEPDQAAMIILDLWSHHRSDEFVNLLISKRLFPVFVPGGSTGTLQPQDVSFNRPFKAKLCERFDNWFFALPDEDRAAAGTMKVCVIFCSVMGPSFAIDALYWSHCLPRRSSSVKSSDGWMQPSSTAVPMLIRVLGLGGGRAA